MNNPHVETIAEALAELRGRGLIREDGAAYVSTISTAIDQARADAPVAPPAGQPVDLAAALQGIADKLDSLAEHVAALHVAG